MTVLALANGALAREPRIVSQEKSTTKVSGRGECEAVLYRIEVPENRSNPESNLIQLAVRQVKSPNPDAGAPIFCLAGGPGGSSIQMARQSLFFDPALLDLGDIVGVDQRGIGKSTPRLIYDDIKFAIPYDQPGEPKSLLAIVEAAHKKAYARLIEQGVDPAGYNTEESADDIDAVRAVLGYESMRVIGGSYGSHLAFSLARRHADTVDRVVVQSPEGPDHTFKRPGQIQEGLELLAARASENEQIRQHVPDLVGMLESVLARLEKQPVYVEVEVPKSDRKQRIGVSKFDVQRLVASALGRNSSARNIPRLVYEMHQGDFTGAANVLVRFRGERTGVHAMGSLVDLASWATDARFEQIKREAETTVLGDAVDFPSYELADAWGRHLLDDDFRGPLDVAVPFLIIVGDLDARTPPSNAREILASLPNGQMVTVTNGAHDFSILLNKEARAVVHQFLAGEPVEIDQIVAPPVSFARIEK